MSAESESIDGPREAVEDDHDAVGDTKDVIRVD